MNQVTGKLIELKPVENGTSKAGKPYSKQTFILDISTTRQDGTVDAKILALETLNKTVIDFLAGYRLKTEITAKYDVSSREYNGKYYHNITCFHVSSTLNGETPPLNTTTPVQDAAGQSEYEGTPPSDDLGF